VLGVILPESGGTAIGRHAVRGDATDANCNSISCFGVTGVTNGFGYGVYGINTNVNGFAVFSAGRLYAGAPSGSTKAIISEGDIVPQNTNLYKAGQSNFAFSAVYSYSYPNPSDARLKKDVKDLDHGLPELLQLRPVTYRWKDAPDKGTQLGLIAQEVEKILPEVVIRDKDPSGMLAINYPALVPVLIRGIQEQERALRAQEARIQALERARNPITASMVSPNSLPMWLGFGAGPVAWILASRRRRKS
jgi:hypothetical protein